ncbi:transcription repressor NadR [uncultured Anaerococcus sp.]|uniref:transcription repressor NadR n=1 Tax=uncultured Anaerococcus sp. TaxID=293428 RepID=UPI0026291A18|nr:transcription repressor NadR [uncultured Anaerococcus sp.]
MSVDERRLEIIKILQNNKKPISGKILADRFAVSRQIIVKDISILKASGFEIDSTNRGYKLITRDKIEWIVKVKHKKEDIKDELNTIVDCGANIKDVFIKHDLYGMIKKDLSIKSRNGVSLFIKNMDDALPLLDLTEEVHYHTIEACSMEIIDKVLVKLKDKGYLIE